MLLAPILAVTAGLLSVPASDPRLALESEIPRLMREGDVPGLAIALVVDGKLAWVGAFGTRDAGAATASRVDAETIFEAASLTKPVFAYAALKLADAGRLDLDAPISKLLPGDYAEDPRLRLITPRQVLSHTSGLPNWRGNQPLQTHFAPGERFSYSGEGFAYLQKALERALDRPIDSVLRSLVFEPLGMSSSSLVWQERFDGRKVSGHDGAGTVRPVRRPTEANAAASLHTTASDYARFLIAAMQGTGLRPATAEQMTATQVRVDEACSNCVARKPSGKLSKELAWGLGWGLQETPEGRSIWHWGDNNNEVNCFVVGYPSRNAGLVVFTNSGNGHGIIPAILEVALGRPQPAYAWLGYERYDSPARTLFKEMLARGAPALVDYRQGRAKKATGEALSEQQVNRLGYWLLGRKRVTEAIAAFEMNVADHPDSWNVHDSLGEAYEAAGRKENAVAAYKRSLELNPSSASGTEALRRLAR